MPALEPTMADDDYCYLTTIRRVSGGPHTIEIWFGLTGSTLYMLSGNGESSDWVRNLRRSPIVGVRIRDVEYPGTARDVRDGDEDGHARALLVGKYQPRYSGELAEWGRTSLPVAVDLDLT